MAALLAPGPRVTKQTPSPTADLFEAYFSNFIEGTEFEVSEAVDIVINGNVPQQRSADAHDVLGTYQLIEQRRIQPSLPTDAADFIEQLKIDHRVLMQARPDKRPGEFKNTRNRVGDHPFVEPSNVYPRSFRRNRLKRSDR